MKNETIRKMQEIRLSAMAEAFEIQLHPTPFWIVCSANRIRSRLTVKSL